MTALSRHTKEMLVLDLYYNQDKTYRQIAKEARICPRDIKTIVDKKAKVPINIHIITSLQSFLTSQYSITSGYYAKSEGAGST